MNTVIVYASVHHGNTKKIVEAIARTVSADTIDLTHQTAVDLSDYEVIGIASGVYYNKLHEKVERFLREHTFQPNQKVFLAVTCGAPWGDYTKNAKETLAKRGVSCIGSFQCRGYDTYAVFGKIGGIARNHPNARDLYHAKAFIRGLVTE